jgi:dihydrofolate reductase
LFSTTGAILTGGRTYDIVNGWESSHPIHDVPVFVLSKDVPEKVPKGKSTLTFVTDGIISVVKQAKAAAGAKNVYVLGGANTAQQCLGSGLLDEMQIHLVPVLLGDGARLFDHIGIGQIELVKTRAIDSPGVSHLRFRVIK